MFGRKKKIESNNDDYNRQNELDHLLNLRRDKPMSLEHFKGINPKYVEVNGMLMELQNGCTTVSPEAIHNAAIMISPDLTYASPFLDGDTIRFRYHSLPRASYDKIQKKDPDTFYSISDTEPSEKPEKKLKALVCNSCGAGLNKSLRCEYCQTQYVY